MKKYLKKFGIMFVMTLILSLGFCISAFADDNGVVGTANLNNTAENSAKKGDQLKTPEVGWKRYDDTNSRIKYDSHFSTYSSGSNSQAYWKDGIHYLINNTTDKIKFKFYGSKIRIITSLYPAGSSNIRINIDGIDDSFSEYSSPGQIFSIVFENKALENKVHEVEINKKNIDQSQISIDAIDIDDTGYLIPYDESITLDHSTMDLKTGDSQELAATTTPAGAQITWTSSDSSVATVDSTGKVTGVKEGTCTITATTVDGLTATCAVTVTKKDDPQPTNPTQPTGDANLFIELVDGQIKQYTVSQDEINKFTSWFENRDKDHSLTATYKFTKGTYKDYVVHDQIDWFEVR